MQTGLSRIGGLFALILFLGATATSPARARQIPPDQVLKDNGLKRPAGATWILVGEARALKNILEAKGLAMQLIGAATATARARNG